MRIAIVLDTSAVVGFAQAKDVSVGEILGEIADDQAAAAIPVAALALAHSQLRDAEPQSMLTLLCDRNPAVVVVPMPADEGRIIGEYDALLGRRLGLAHAVREAERHEAMLLTADGDVVRDVFGEIHGVVDL